MSNKEKISQSSIKNENTLAIFDEISRADGISRADISERTGLSLMTVGKVADTLTHEGIIIQAKPATGSAGRRAGMLTLSEDYFILALDISTPEFRAASMDLHLEPMDTVIYQYNTNLFPEDNLVIFFRETGTLLMKHLMSKKMVGTGICVPGEYDIENDTVISPKLKELAGLKISETMKKSIGFTPDTIMNSAEAAALSAISELPSEKCGCTVSLNLGRDICGSVAFDKSILSRPSDFESLLCENGMTLGRNISEISDEEELCRQIGSALKPIISVLCPDSVFICSSERSFSEWFPSLLGKELKTPACEPEIIFENSKNYRSDMGLAQLIRSDMIKKL
ncbi:MAG: winged helix-turn-helix domain-containing protein [Clostridia bacterium]|nr:winged helix-turn-helix domain-containing protein [Clostridia bacterium]